MCTATTKGRTSTTENKTFTKRVGIVFSKVNKFHGGLLCSAECRAAAHETGEWLQTAKILLTMSILKLFDDFFRQRF